MRRRFYVCLLPASLSRWKTCSPSLDNVPLTHYFDDFTPVAPAAVAEAMSNVAKEFLDLLGWDGKSAKEKPMNMKSIG